MNLVFILDFIFINLNIDNKCVSFVDLCLFSLDSRQFFYDEVYRSMLIDGSRFSYRMIHLFKQNEKHKFALTCKTWQNH